MHRLDPLRTHGIIYGLSGAAFEQDGRQFNSEGEQVIVENLPPIRLSNGEYEVRQVVRKASEAKRADTKLQTKPATVIPKVEEKPEEPKKLSFAEPEVEEKKAEPEALKQDSGKKFKDMHWSHLKKLVESFGGTWKNTDEAIKFLEGKDTESAA